MTTIKLLDARRGLNLKCRELFKDEKIAEEVYRYLCDGIEECEDAVPEQWIVGKDENGTYGICSECGMKQYAGTLNFCPNCGADCRGEQDD